MVIQEEDILPIIDLMPIDVDHMVMPGATLKATYQYFEFMVSNHRETGLII